MLVTLDTRKGLEEAREALALSQAKVLSDFQVCFSESLLFILTCLGGVPIRCAMTYSCSKSSTVSADVGATSTGLPCGDPGSKETGIGGFYVIKIRVLKL